MDNHEWQQWLRKTRDEDKQNKTKNTTQYVLGTTMHKQK
jgi:hypothetical protein